MAKKPEPPPPQPKTWTIYKVADYGIGTRWLGTVGVARPFSRISRG
jgi:hypothetical protein